MHKWMSIAAIALGTVLTGASSSSAQTPVETPAQTPTQTPPPQTPPPAPARTQTSSQTPPSFLNISAGGQVTKTHFTNSSTFTDFGETGTVDSNQNVGQGFVFDVRGGRLMWGKFGIGAGLWVSRQNGASASTASIPDPLIVGQFTTVSSTATDLKQTAVGVDVQLVWMTMFNDRFGMAFAVGPSIIHVSQDIGSISVAPNTQNVTPTSTKESGTSGKAGNVGLDFSYLVTSNYGAGVFIRYAGGKVGLPTAPSLKVGGLQLGGGLRVRF
jgi:hypothetical protein